MIADLKPYPEYRGSGLPWLGDIPEHWASERAKWLFTKMDRPVREDDEVVTCFRDGMVTLRKNRRLSGFTEATVYSGYQGVRKGDLVIHGMDAFAGAIGVSDSDGKGTPVYNVCQPRPGVSASYYAHLVRKMSQSQWILALAKGIRERSTDFRFEMFGNQRVPLPPPAEQAAIVRFLDWANGRLERAIRAKRKVITLLNEQKQAVIHRAVTRGLDPSVTLKPSGIPWLGDIPQHWEVRRLRTLVDESVAGPYGSSLTKSMYTQAGYRVYGQQQVIPDDFLVGDYFISKERFDRMQRYQAFVGDILVSVMGTVGKVAVVPEDAETGIINPRLVRYRPNTKVVMSRWLQLAMQDRTAQTQLIEASKGTTMNGLNMQILGNLQLLVPPLVEQQEILETVSTKRQPFVKAISRLEREIELLREYRTRLVADVVTGKLDVREVAARLPDDLPAVSRQDPDLIEADEDGYTEEESGVDS